METRRFRGLVCALSLVLTLAGCDHETGESTEETAPGPPLTGLVDCDSLIASYGVCLLARPARMERNGALFQAEVTSLSAQAKDPVLSEGVAARCKALFRPRLRLDCE